MRLNSESIFTRLPEGTRALIAQICMRHRIRQAEFIRLALLRALEAEGVDPAPLAKRSVNLEATA